MLQKLSALKVLSSSKSSDFIATVVCDSNKIECMHRTCDKCKQKIVNLVENGNLFTSYYKWITKTEDRLGAKNLIYHVKITSKVKIMCSINDLIKELNKEAEVYLKHIHDTTHQYKALASLRKNLSMNEVMLVCDFSENYNCKYSSEIQSVHFGASLKQISLHIGAFFLRNKSNFWLFKTHNELLNLSYATWNFTTPGHGKSVADGIGGSVKGLCNRAVCQGQDVISVTDMVRVLKSSTGKKTMIFDINTQDVDRIDEMLQTNLKTIPNTMKTLQMIWIKEKKEYLF
ncbi:hypothetical protein ALC62_10258 [Cyphomyrmex costatus]|uniref:Uncharacterized protein n=1 Tax=Cyphomyrmex costatus TaxID=456900 RepID=A0A151IEA5_9HYME|nr:hypothetical protein ALC62_10258 [Cyphomyrmex costatus]